MRPRKEHGQEIALLCSLALAATLHLSATGCAREHDLRLNINPSCAPPAPITAVKLNTFELDIPLMLTAYGDPECLEINPAATAQDPGTLLLPFITRGYVVDDLPVGRDSVLLLTLYAESGPRGRCLGMSEAMCGLSMAITPDLWNEPEPSVSVNLLCAGDEPPSGFGFSECLSVSRNNPASM